MHCTYILALVVQSVDVFPVQTLFVTWWASVETKTSSVCRLRPVEPVCTLPHWPTTSCCFAVCSTSASTATWHCASRFTCWVSDALSFHTCLFHQLSLLCAIWPVGFYSSLNVLNKCGASDKLHASAEAWYLLSQILFVRPSHTCIVSKQLNKSSHHILYFTNCNSPSTVFSETWGPCNNFII